jgi:hypothetical protein
MSLYSWNCEHCGTLLDNTTTFHRCTDAPRSTTDIDPAIEFEHFPPRDTAGVPASSGEGLKGESSVQTKPACSVEGGKEKM